MTSGRRKTPQGESDDTKMIETGRHAAPRFHALNPPVERASTMIFPDYATFKEEAPKIRYGRLGASTHRAFEESLCALEGAAGCVLAPSGLAAITLSILACTEAGAKILVSDAVYGPTRYFCDQALKRFGVETVYYDPMTDITPLMDGRVSAVMTESPGSLTFEVQDVPAAVEAAQATGAAVLCDNTWGAGYFYKPLALGADISIQACTKYVVGHADALIGAVLCRDEATHRKVFRTALNLGLCVSPDDVYLAHRGLRTMGTRLRQHEATGKRLAGWLADRPEIEAVLHPARPDCPGHEIWRRDFTGATGLFGAVLKPEIDDAALGRFLDASRHFAMGFSWGGYESLCVPVRPERDRTVRPWPRKGRLLRFHAGLEDADDLIADLEAAFHAMAGGAAKQPR
ncbi:MAG: cystathionine beta-lyase [Pseudomonadota bacterium]